MIIRRVLLAIVVLILVAGAGLVAIGTHSEIAAIAPPTRSSFDPTVITRGAQLAAIGNCARCHTASGGKSFAGGFPVETPFGTIYGTNITPDPETGIGGWSEAAFARALHDGIDRRGRHLYPAFPYDHFTRVSDDDTQALYAYLMTRQPVQATAPQDRLVFPLNIRLLVAGWNLLFLDAGRFQPDPTKPSDWNRGAYLAEGLGHCGACHTPRNLLGAEQHDREYAGGEGEGWRAPPLDVDSPAPIPWDADALFAYLQRGLDQHHGIAAGPMAPVVADLADVADKDVQALATYIASRAGAPTPDRAKRAQELIASAAGGRAESTGAADRGGGDGATIFAGGCAACHGDGFQSAEGRPALVFSSALNDVEARDAIHIILDGIRPAEGTAGPLMPGFSGALTVPQLTALLAYLRSELTDKEPWPDVPGTLRSMRRAGDKS